MIKKEFLRNKAGKYAAIIIISVLTLCAASGCGRVQFTAQTDSKTLLIVDGEECTIAEGVFRLMEVKDQYYNETDDLFWERSVGDLTMEEYIKESVKEEMTRITSSVIMADKLAVTLTEEEIEELTETAEKSYNTLAESHDLSSYGITLETAISLYTKQAYYDKVYDELSADIETQISETDTKVIEVNYVEIPLETSSDDAEALRSAVQSGTDFEEACSEYGFEAMLNQVLSKGSMPDEFESVAYALVDGELSEIIETDDCYYLIQCVEDYLISESVANNNQVIADARQEAFNEAYTEFSSDAVLQFNEEAWEKVNIQEI